MGAGVKATAILGACVFRGLWFRSIEEGMVLAWHGVHLLVDPCSSEKKTWRTTTKYARNRQHINIFLFSFVWFHCATCGARKARHGFCGWVCGEKWCSVLFGCGGLVAFVARKARMERTKGNMGL